MTLVDRWKKLIEEHLHIINVEFTREGVKRVMSIIPDDKAHRADGFESKFFKHY